MARVAHCTSHQAHPPGVAGTATNVHLPVLCFFTVVCLGRWTAGTHRRAGSPLRNDDVRRAAAARRGAPLISSRTRWLARVGASELIYYWSLSYVLVHSHGKSCFFSEGDREQDLVTTNTNKRIAMAVDIHSGVLYNETILRCVTRCP